MRCAMLICGGSSWAVRERGERTEQVRRIRVGRYGIVVYGRCWDDQMAGQWLGPRCDIWFGPKPRQRSEVVMMLPEPCALRRGQDMPAEIDHSGQNAPSGRASQQGIAVPVRR
jgi:hypothetical protein